MTEVKLPQSTCTMAVKPDTINHAQSATLAWECQNTTAADIQPGIGGVVAKGSRSVVPNDTTDYSLKGTGAGGTATTGAKLTVNPLPPEKRSITLDIQFDTAKADIK